MGSDVKEEDDKIIVAHFAACRLEPQQQQQPSAAPATPKKKPLDEDIANEANAQTMNGHHKPAAAAPTPAAGASTSFKVNSFYLDSSGRVQVSMPLQLSFASKEALQKVLASNCVQPPPPPSNNDNETINAEKKEEGVVENGSANLSAAAASLSSFALSLEARVTMTYGSGEAISALVERVAIQSTRVHNDMTTLQLWVQAHLRVSRQADGVLTSVPGAKLNLEVTALLARTQKPQNKEQPPALISSATTTLQPTQERQALAEGLRDLYLGRYQPQQQSTSKTASFTATVTSTNARHVVTQTKLLPPLVCQVSLIHALSVTCRSMKGPTLGETWLALDVQHPNTHRRPVTLTNVTLHPAFSQTRTTAAAPAKKKVTLTKSASGGSSAAAAPAWTTVDMSQNVQWRFPSSENDSTKDNGMQQLAALPKTLQPNEAFTLVLYVTAEEETLSRAFSCPVAVTALLQQADEDGGQPPAEQAETKAPATAGMEITSVVQGSWTSAKRAAVPSDSSFRVHFGLPPNAAVTVGQLFSVQLSVQNLGPQRKNLKVVVVVIPPPAAQASSTGGGGLVFENPDMTQLLLLGANSTAAAATPGDAAKYYQQQLLAVDDSCWLGTVESDQTVQAELRFIPLCPGTLALPNFELAVVHETASPEKLSRSSSLSSKSKAATKSPATATTSTTIYRCLHNLQVVASSADS